ncbi:ferredoxin [Alteribacillus iranensis]|uniref:Ferredoxin n=1 Tax=Alteribacillus iranensis TaxID=930128 RepID=A0A1I2CRS1_9BACI|nr:ferredoxin [Alteribacillus iranensis]SFE71069.1 ferredoxin [Alteribacillus iranensis]
MKVYTMVDQETCISCGACGASAPDLFDYNDEGLSYFIGDNNEGNTPIDEELLEDLEDAIDGCPTDSIKKSSEAFHGDPANEHSVSI